MQYFSLLVLAVAMATASAACDFPTFFGCAKNFFKNFNFNLKPDNSAEFDVIFRHFLATTDANGIANMCQWAGAFTSCAGGAAAAAECVKVSVLQAHGSPARDAADFVGQFRYVGYFCGPGFSTIHGNWACISHTTAANLPLLGQCRKTFNQQTQQNPAQVCTFANQFLHCQSAPFATACGANVANAGCNAAKAFLSAPLPQCNQLMCNN